MEDLIYKHKEVISKIIDVSDETSQYLAKSCALITQRHGETQRLEGMIEVLKRRSKLWTHINDELEELEKQLKELKG